MPDNRNNGIAVTNGNVNSVNVAVGDRAKIIDRHVVHSSTVSSSFTNAERLVAEAALHDKVTKGRLVDWAGSARVTLAIVFTDIVDSTNLGQQMGDEAWTVVRRAHFAQSRSLIQIYGGHEIKTIGDSFMVVFKAAGNALDYALDLYETTGHHEVKIRAGLHVGALEVEDDDVFGGEVNYAARVIGTIQGAEIRVSDRVKRDIDQARSRGHRGLQWKRYDDVKLKGFKGEWTLWSLPVDMASL